MFQQKQRFDFIIFTMTKESLTKKSPATVSLQGFIPERDLNREALLRNNNTQILVVKNMYQKKNSPTEAISVELFSTRERT